MTQTPWAGDSMASGSSQVGLHPQRRLSNLSYNMTTTPQQSTNNSNGRNLPSLPHMQMALSSIPSINPPYTEWTRSNPENHLGWLTQGPSAQTGPGLRDIQMGNYHYSYSNPPAPATSSEQFNGNGAEASPSPSDYREPSRSLRTPPSRILYTNKGRPRARTRESSGLGPDNGPTPIRWVRGIKSKPIPEDATDQEKKQLMEYNRQVAAAKKAHNREQNRISARRSREKKQHNLDQALERIQELEGQNASLHQEVQKLREEIANHDRFMMVELMHGRMPGMQPQAFNSYPPPLPRANVHGQTPMPPPNQFPTPIQGPASSPAAGSTCTPGSVQQYGSFMQHQPQSTPNPNPYQSMMPPQNQVQNSVQSHHLKQTQYPVQNPHSAVQAQSASTTQTSFAYGFGATNDNSQAPAHEQHAHTPGTLQGGLQGNIHENPQANPQGNLNPNLQSNPQGNVQPNTLSEEPPEHASGSYLGNSTEQEQEQKQKGQQEQQQNEPNMGAFETGPIDPTLEFMNFGSPLNPETPAQNKPSNAG